MTDEQNKQDEGSAIDNDPAAPSTDEQNKQDEGSASSVIEPPSIDNVVWLDEKSVDLVSFKEKQYVPGWYQVEIVNSTVELNGTERRLTDEECAALNLRHDTPPQLSNINEASSILDTAPSNGKPESHFCEEKEKHCVPVYRVIRTVGAAPTLACKECIGPAYTYVSMEEIKQ